MNYETELFTSGQYGTISGYFVLFDHSRTDLYKEVFRKGAFAESIARRKATGHPFPLLLNHDYNSIVGMVTDIGEDEHGGYFTADFFPTEKAQETKQMVKAGVLWQFSFGYTVLDYGRIRTQSRDREKVSEIREAELYEISLATVPGDDRATMISFDEGTGRTLAANNLLRHYRNTRGKADEREREPARPD